MSLLKDSSSGKVICGSPEPPIPDHHSAGRYFYDRLIEGGEKIALIDGRTGAHVTYRQVLQGAVTVALALENRGVGRGDLVLICSENCFEVSYAIIGVLFTGATVAMASISYSQDELTHAMSVAQPKLVLCSSEASTRILSEAATLTCLETILTLNAQTPRCKQISLFLATDAEVNRYRPQDVVGDKDASIMLYSSGTTGLSKGVLWNHISFLLLMAEAHFYMRNITRTEGTPTSLVVTSWSHAYGFVSMFASLTNHYRVVFFPRFMEEPFFKAVDAYKVNLVFLVPALMTLLTKSAFADCYDLSSIKQIWSSSAVLSKDLELATCKRFGVPYVRHSYATTEGGYITIPDDNAFRHGSVGRLTMGVAVKLINPETNAAVGVGEPGELLVHSRQNMLGYRNDPEATRTSFNSDGFLHTGDVAYYDADMYFYMVDRVKDLIKYKGFQVPPTEVENALKSHPAVLDCCVLGLPDELAGELPLAVVVLRPGTTATEIELQNFVATKVSSPKRLRGGVRFVSSIPRNVPGKLLRQKLREMISVKSRL